MAHPDNEIKCLHCGAINDIESADCVSACPDNIYCHRCDIEIESSTGLPGLLCGRCVWCKEFDEEAFTSLQSAAQQRLAAAKVRRMSHAQ